MSLNFTYLPRTIETVINRASQRYKGAMVTGMRQVGKSTMLRRMLGDRRYVNLDRYQALDLARQAPDALLSKLKMCISAWAEISSFQIKGLHFRDEK